MGENRGGMEERVLLIKYKCEGGKGRALGPWEGERSPFRRYESSGGGWVE